MSGGNDAKESDRFCGLVSTFNIFCSNTAGELRVMILFRGFILFCRSLILRD